MRRWSLVLLLSVASAALAQQAPPTAPAPAVPPPAAPAAPAAPPPSGPPTPGKAATSAKREPTLTLPPMPTPDPKTGLAPGMYPNLEDNSTAGLVRVEARNLFKHLLNGDVRGGADDFVFPFQLEDKKFETPEALVTAWIKQLRNKRLDLITLYDIEVLPYAEMEKKYGKPPARLGALVPRGAEVYVAVANLSGHAACVLYRQVGADWRPFAYTD